MGVRGLTTFINNNRSKYMESYKLHDTTIVIDGNNIACQLYKWHCKRNDCFGGDYDKYAKVVFDFFALLRDCNVTPIVVFDGGYENKKMKTVFSRLKKKVRSAKYINSSNQKNIMIFPILMNSLFTQIVVKLNYQIVRTDFEADYEMACLAQNLNCPMLSYDSDFYIFDVVYLPFSTFHMAKYSLNKTQYYIKCEMYRIDNFIDAYPGLSKTTLPLMATLLGNDYISKRSFKQFFDEMKIPRARHLKSNQQQTIITLLKWMQNETFSSAVNKIVNRMKKKHTRRVLSNIKFITRGYICRKSILLSFLNIEVEDDVGTMLDLEVEGEDDHGSENEAENPESNNEDLTSDKEDSKSDDEDPSSDDEDSKSDDEDPKSDDEDSKSDDEDSKSDDENSKSDDEDSKSDDEDSKSDDEDLKNDYEDPKGDDEDPKGVDEDLKGYDKDPKGDDEDPKGNDEDPKGNDEDPKGDDEDPKGDDENPKSNDKDPKSNDEGPKSENENPKPDNENQKGQIEKRSVNQNHGDIVKSSEKKLITKSSEKKLITKSPRKRFRKSSRKKVIKKSNVKKLTINDLPSWFLQNFRKCKYPSNFMDILTRNKYFCNPQVENYAIDSSYKISVGVLAAINKILTSGNLEHLTYVSRRRRHGLRNFRTDPCKLNLPKLFEIENLNREELKNILLTVLEIDREQIEFLNDIPENWHLYILSILFWIKNSNPKVTNTQLYSLCLCMLVLSIVDPQVGFFRSTTKFSNKLDATLKGLSKTKPDVAVLPEGVNFKNLLDGVTYDHCVLGLKELITFFQMEYKMANRPAIFNIQILHPFAELQTCLLHIQYLNMLLNEPFQNFLISEFYDGTFIYNMTVNLMKRIDVESYLNVLLGQSSSILLCCKFLFNKILKSSNENITNTKGKRRRKKNNKKGKLSVLSFVDDENELTKSEDEDENLVDVNNKFSLLNLLK